MKKPILLIIALTIITFGLSIVRIYISNQIDTSGIVLAQIQEQIDSYKMQNILLAQQLYTQTSLTNISAEVFKLGYVETGSNFVLNGQLPVAYKQ